MGVEIYSIIKIAKKPAHKVLHAGNLEPIVVRSGLMSAENFATSKDGSSRNLEAIQKTFLDSDQYSTHIDVAGKQIAFSRREMDSFKKKGNINECGLRLLYFMPVIELALDSNKREPYFLCPDNNCISGSSVLIESLVKDMMAKQLVGIVRYNRGSNSIPCIAVLVPSVEGEQEMGLCRPSVAIESMEEEVGVAGATGFHLIPLPFSNDKRANPLGSFEMQTVADVPGYSAAVDRVELEEKGRETMEIESLDESTRAQKLLQASQALIQALQLSDTMDYSMHIENPVLQRFYAVLQAIALQEAKPEWDPELHDRMRPAMEYLASTRSGEEHQSEELQSLMESIIGEFKTLSGLDTIGQKPKKAPAKGKGSETTEKEKKDKKEPAPKKEKKPSKRSKKSTS